MLSVVAIMSELHRNPDSAGSSSGRQSSTGSVSRLFPGLANGDQAAQAEIFDRFFAIVTRLADQKLGQLPRRVADEEDVALNVMHDALTGIRERRFRDLQNRQDLWQIVWDLINKRSHDLTRSLLRQKHDVRREVGDDRIGTGSDSSSGNQQFVPTDDFEDPEFIVNETRESLLASLDDPELREIASKKCDGMTSAEIADELRVTTSRVDFKWKVIRAKWIDELQRRGEFG
jgi:DNA-directed RNA polymerase specialized sigma24 family protein